jgi:hypothetical protein
MALKKRSVWLTAGMTLLLAGGARAGDDLIVNGDAETGDISGWTDPSGNGYSIVADVEVVYDGDFSFQGGLTGPAGAWTHEVFQDIDVSALAMAIDAGDVTSTFEGFGRSNSAGGATDNAWIVVEFRDISDAVVESYDSGNIVPVNQWNQVQDIRTLPVNTRSIRVWLRCARSVGSSTDAYHDNVSLVLDVLTPADPITWSRVKATYR